MDGGDFLLSNVDKRIVQMEFDNKQFEKDMQVTVKSLHNFEKDLNNVGTSGKAFEGISKGLDSVKANVKGFSLDAVSNAFEKVKVTISGWEMAAMAAITRVVDGAMNAAQNMARSLITGPISQGFEEYELKMNAVQTMLLGAQAIDPSVNLEKVNKTLDELNVYADKTIYSFADMKDNVAKFINAGIGLEDSAAAIQGISNWAAVAGANTQQASHAMYNLSQALATGYVQRIDWKSIENAQMNTVEFMREALSIAQEVGTVAKIQTVEGNKYVALTKNNAGSNMEDTVNVQQMFNQGLQYQWLTTEVLTKTLQKYSDETTELGKKAMDAATHVKTFSQLMETLKEAIGSGWAVTWEHIFGDFEESKKLWTSINDVVSGFINKQADARNAILKTWAEMGGRATFFEALKNIFIDISEVMKPIQEAFREIFGGLSAGKLVSFSRNLANLSYILEPTKEEILEIKDVFKSLFQFVKSATEPLFRAWKEAFPAKTIVDYIKSIISFIGELIKSGSDIFNMLTNNGEVIHKISLLVFSILKALFGLISGIFTVVKNVIRFLSPVINFISKIIGYFVDFIFSLTTVFTKMKNVGEAFSDLSKALENVITPIKQGLTSAFEKVNPHLDNFKKWIKDVVDWLSNWFVGLIKSSEERLKSFSEIVSNTSTKFSNFKDKTQKAGKSLKSFRESVKKTSKIVTTTMSKSDAGNNFVSGIASAFNWVKNAFSNIGKWFSDIFQAIKEKGLPTVIKDAFKIMFLPITQGTKTIAKYLKPARDALLEFFGSENLIDLIESFLSIFIRFKTGKVLGGFSNLLKTLSGDTGVLKQIANSFSGFVGSITAPFGALAEQLGTKKTKSSLKIFAESVLMIAASMFILSKIPSDSLIPIASTLAGLMITLSIVMGILNKTLSKNTGAASTFAAISLLMKAFSKALSSIVLGLAVIMLVVNKVGGDNAKTAAIIVSSISGLLIAFIALLSIFSKNRISASQVNSYALLIKAMGSAIKTIAIVIGILSLFDSGKLWLAALAVDLLTVLLFGGLIFLFERGSRFGLKPTQVLSMAVLIKAMGTAIKTIAIVIGILSLFDSGKLMIAAGVVDLLTVLLFGGLIFMFKAVSDPKLKPTQVLSMAVLIKAMGTAIKTIAIVIGILSLPIFNEEALKRSLNIIILIGALLGGLMVITSKNVDPAKAKVLATSMLLIATSIGILSVSLIKLSKTDPESLTNSLTTLIIMLTATGIIAVGISRFAVQLEVLGKAFLAFGAAAALFGAGIFLVVKAVKIMNGIGPQATQVMTDMITALVSNIPKWVGLLITGLFDALTKMVPSIAKSIVNLIVEVIKVVTQSTGVIISAIVNLFKAITSAFLSYTNAFDVKDLFWAVQSIALIAGIIYVMAALANDKDSFVAALKGVALIAAVMAILIGALAIVNSFGNSERTIEMIKGIAAAVLSLAAIFAVIGIVSSIMAKMSGGSGAAQAKSLFIAIGAFLALIIGMVVVVGIIGWIAQALIDADIQVISYLDTAITVMQKVGQAIGGLMGALVGTFASFIDGKSIPLLLAAAPLIMALSPLISVLPILGLLFVALGGILFGLNKLTKGFVIESLIFLKDIMPLLAEAIGTFLGILIKKVLELVTDTLIYSMTSFAEGLSTFMQKLQPFLTAVQKIDKETLEKTGMLALIILEMVGTELLRGLTHFLSFITGGSISFVAFAAELATMAPYLTQFSNELKKGNFNGDVAEKAANVALMMANVANNLPKQGGWWQKIVGDNVDMDTFGTQLEGLGKSLVLFGTEVNKLTPKQIEAIGAAATAVKNLVDVANAMPKEGGVWQKIVGETTDMDVFGTQLEGLGTALVSFAKSVSEITSDQIKNVENVVPIINSLVEISKSMPSGGGVWQKIVGESMDMEDFGKKMKWLAIGLYNFAFNIAGIDTARTEQLTNAVEIIKSIVDVSNLLSQSKEGGVAGWFGGSSKEDLKTFSEKLPILGDGISQFAEKTKNIGKMKNVKYISDAIISLSNAFQNTSDTGAFTGTFLGRLGALIHGDSKSGKYEWQDWWKASLLLGPNDGMGSVSNTMAENAYKRIVRVGDAMSALSTAFQNTSDAGAFSGTFLGRLGDLVHGNGNYKAGDLLDASNLLGKSNENVQMAYKRIIAISNAMKAFYEVFQATSDAGSFSGTFLGRIGDLVNGNGNYKAGDLLKAANILGTDNTKVQDAYKRINAVGKSIEALSRAFESTANLDSTSINDFTEAINAISSLSIDAIKDDMINRTAEVVEAANSMIFNLGTAFINKKEPLKGNVKTMLSGISGALSDTKKPTVSSFDNFFKACLDAINAYNLQDPSKPSGFYLAGINSAKGYVRGIESRLIEVLNAGRLIGEKALEGANKAVDNRSPSHKFDDYVAYNSVMGFVRGFRKRAHLALEAGEYLGQNALNGTQGIVSRIDNILNSDMNLQPVITPVLDLSQMSIQSGRIGGILNANNSVIAAGRASSLIEQGRMLRLDARINQNGSPDVVAAVENLTNRMDSMEEAIINRPIELDGDRVTKKLTPRVDKALGQRAYYSRRGN